MQKSKTYFEQISVALLTKIVKEDDSDKNTEKDSADATIAIRKLKTHRSPSLGKHGKSV